MKSDVPEIFSRGIGFVRTNPQLIYTLFLVVAIPLAFFFTSEQFLKVASENQDRLERSRIALLKDAFAEFLPDHLEQDYLNKRIAHLAAQNETITSFSIILPDTSVGEEGGVVYVTLASLHAEESGKPYTPDGMTSILMKLAVAQEGQSFAMAYTTLAGRYWKSVRAVPLRLPDMPMAYIVTDISMAQADAVSRQNIRNAYLVLAIIILFIIVLLARQARIIDYAALYSRLKEVDQMKDDFVSMAAHELRSPLTIIRGYVDMLSGGGVSDAGKEHLKNIDRAAVQLNTLIGDILDVAKLQEGRMSFTYKTLDVSPEITTVVESFAKPAHDKGLTLVYTPATLPPIAVDTDRFRQIMINLVGNAIKYTPTGEVRVAVIVEREQVVIRVSDTGMGISAEDQQKLFQKFFRVKNEETQMITGTGLGLWITTQMVKTMKGTISVESIKGKGTDFILTFPIVK